MEESVGDSFRRLCGSDRSACAHAIRGAAKKWGPRQYFDSASTDFEAHED